LPREDINRRRNAKAEFPKDLVGFLMELIVYAYADLSHIFHPFNAIVYQKLYEYSLAEPKTTFARHNLHKLSIGQSLSKLKPSFREFSEIHFIRSPFIPKRYKKGDKIAMAKFSCRANFYKELEQAY
jgi:hypothetical protein